MKKHFSLFTMLKFCFDFNCDAMKLLSTFSLLSKPAIRALPTNFNTSDCHIVTLKNGTVAALHPQKEPSYHSTQAVDLEAVNKEKRALQELQAADSYERRHSSIYKEDGPDNITLQNIFTVNPLEFKTRSREDRLHETAAPIPKPLWFGRLPYLSGLSIQEKLFEKLYNNKQRGIFKNHYICLFEHDPVYTVGLRGHLYSQDEEDRLRNLGADFVRTKRGGMITFHGPGQLVAYPLCDLNHLQPHFADGVNNTCVGVKAFVNCIEEVLIQMLTNDFNISSVGRTENAGVWVESHRKIAAIGIQIRNEITSHGFALNCNTDLRWFDNIVPCGIKGKESTSISNELSKNVSAPSVLPYLCPRLESVFNCKVEFLNCTKDSDRMIYC